MEELGPSRGGSRGAARIPGPRATLGARPAVLLAESRRCLSSPHDTLLHQ